MKAATTLVRYLRAALYRLLLLNYHRARRLYWELRAPDLHRRWNADHSDFPVLRALIHDRNIESVLDLGCGTGRFFPLYEEAGLADTLGVDIAARALAVARRLHPGVRTVRQKAEDLDPGRTYDLVVCHRVLQHITPATLPRVADRMTRVAARAIYIDEIGESDHANLTGARYMFEHDYLRLFAGRGWQLAESGLVPGTNRTYLVFAPPPGQQPPRPQGPPAGESAAQPTATAPLATPAAASEQPGALPSLPILAADHVDIARGSLLALVYRATGMVFWLLLSVIVARALSLHELGIYVSTVVLIQSVGAVVASFASASGYFVTRKQRPPAEVASNGLLLAVGVASVLFLGCLAGWLLYDGDRRNLVMLAGLAGFPIIARHGLGGVFLGTNQIWKYNFSIHGPAYAVVGLLLVWVVWLDHRTAEGALAAWTAGQFVALAVLLWMGHSWWRWLVSHRPDWALIREIVSFGAIIGLAGFISYFNYRLDQLLVLWLDGEEGAGVYSRAVSVAEAMWLFSTSIAVASYASVGLLSRQEAAALTSRAVRHTFFVVSAAAVVVFAVAPFMLEILFGPRFSGATTSLRILCIGSALFAPQSLLANYFTIQLGRPWIPLSIALVSCLVSATLGVLLIPQFGYVGAAWATSISYASVGGMAIAFFLATSDARFRDLWRIQRDDVMTYVRLARRVLSGRILRDAAAPAGPST